MTDKIKIATASWWKFLFNGSTVASAENADPNDDNLVIQTDGPWVLTINGQKVASSDVPAPEPEPEPEPEIWPVMPKNLVDTALTLPVPKYKNTTNSNSNYSARGTAMWAALYGYNTGDKRQEVKDNIATFINALTSDGNGPCGMNGPGAAQEMEALTFFHLLRQSDLWPATSSTIKQRIDAIFHALALIRVWEGNDNSKSGGNWTITGMKGTDYKGVGPNISGAIPAQLVSCAEWFGYKELSDWLETTSIAAVRTEVKNAFGGTKGKLYLTLNWRNAGISAAQESSYYRSGPSSDAPTDSDINNALKKFVYYGASLADLPMFLFPNDTRGLNKTMPPTKRTMGGNKWVGYNQPGVNNGAGMMVDGKKRGYVLNNPTQMPWYGKEGSMIYELNGQDEGGIRSCMGYAWWTAFLTNCQLLPVVLNKNSAIKEAKIADFLDRWKKAYDIMKFFDEQNYNSIAHATTKKNGGPGCIVWHDCRADWYPDINFFLWNAINSAALAIK